MINLVATGQPFPASVSQKAMVLAHLGSAKPRLLNIIGRVAIDGPVDPALFNIAVERLAERYPILRAQLSVSDDTVLISPGAYPHVAYSHSNLTGAGPEEVAELLETERNHDFAITDEPLFRSRLATLSATSHVWIFNIHHAIADGWSGSLIHSSLSDIYGALERGESEPRSAEEGFIRFVAGEADYLESERYQTDMRYWSQRLALVAEGDPLPLRMSEGPCQRLQWALSQDESSAFRSFFTAHGCSASDFFCAVLALFLAHRYDLAQLPLEVSVLNRQRQFRDSIGKFVNFLPLLLHVDEDDTLTELIGRSRREHRVLFRHQAFPLAQLAGQMRRLSFPLQYNYQNSKHDQAFAGRPARAEWVPPGQTDRLLTVNVNDFSDEGTALSFDYNADLLEFEEIELMMEQFLALARASVQEPDRKVSEVRLQPQRGRAGGAADRKPAWPPAPFRPAYLETGSVTASAVAITARSTCWTYGRLEEEVAAWQTVLERAGAAKGTRVCVRLAPGPEAIAIMLALWRRGAVYVPVEPEAPVERLRHIYEDSASELCVGCKVAEAGALRWLNPVTTASAIARPSCTVAPEDLAYILYTSGSTGRPKGVMVEHGALDNYVRAFAAYFKLDATDVIAHQASLAFDTSFEEILPALHVGGRIALIEREVLFDPPRLAASLEEQRVTVLSTIPSVLAGLNRSDVPLPSSLRLAISGGEALRPEDCARLAERLAVFNTYGPTEATVCATFHRVRPGEEITLGRPITGVEVHLLNRFGAPAAIGGYGEIVISGKGLARGYVSDPRETASRFAVVALDEGRAERAYRTGDIGRLDKTGEILFAGRRDHQIKLSGARVELGEVEACLRAVPGIVDAAAYVSARSGGLAAAVQADRDITKAELIERLSQVLPLAFIPKTISVVAALPRTASGKPDRRALVDSEPAVDEVERRPPATDVERRLARLWEEVLGTGSVCPGDDFFQLGGNSLLALKLVAALGREFGITLGWKDVLLHSTLSDQAHLLVQAPAATAADAPEEALGTGPYPLSNAQLRLWQTEVAGSGRSAYTIAAALDVLGPVDISRAQGALRAVVARHPALRTVLTIDGRGEPLQKFKSANLVEIEVEDLTNLHGQDVERRTQAFTGRPFHLNDGDLLRMQLQLLGPAAYRLVLSAHHIIADAWSLDLLLRDFVSIYTGRQTSSVGSAQDEDSSPAELLGLYAAASRAVSEGAAADEDYWTRTLAGAPALHQLALDRPRPVCRSFAGGLLSRKLDQNATERLRSLARAHSTTLAVVLHATFASVAARFSRSDDIVIGVSIADRDRPGAGEVAGYFVNMVPIRSRPTPDTPFSTLVAEIKAALVGAIAHSPWPMERFASVSKGGGSLSFNPVFQLCFTSRRAPEPVIVDGISFAANSIPTGSAKFDLLLEAIEKQEGVELVWEYDSDIFDFDTISLLADSHVALIESALKEPRQTISSLELLTAEQRLALGQWNATASPQPEMCVHELVEAQARRAPHAIACRQGERTMSYEELDRRAEQLAARLCARSEEEGGQVALWMDTSPDLLVAMLGCFKAGLAYVPLDRSWPAARLDALIAEMGVRLVATQQHLAPDCPGRADADIVMVGDGANRAASVRRSASLERTAYVIYTSGSTGTPKGVEIAHRALANYTVWAARRYQANEGCGAPVVTSPAFDATVTSLFAPLVAGNIVHFPVARDPLEALGEFAQSGGFSFVKLTPAQLEVLGDLKGQDGRGFCRHFVVGGEALPVEVVRHWRERAPDIEIVNEYGPTEATVGCSAFGISADTVLSIPLPIGVPIDNHRIYVVDEQLTILPPGAVGELVIGGAGLARGYVGSPEGTAERFVTLGTAPDERVYRTGDLGRWRADGLLEFHGRLDQEVKIRGYRIDLEAVEAAIQACPGVARAAAVAHGIGLRRQLVGFAVPEVGAFLEEADVRARLASQLPAYLVPARIVSLTELPITSNHKVDRAALAAFDLESRPDPLALPWLPLESEIARIWADETGVAARPEDTFVAAGGNSLAAIRAANRLTVALGIAVAPQDILSTTLAALARRLASGGAEAPVGPTALSRREYRDYRCSPWQKQVWLASRADPLGCAYNMVASFTLRGKLVHTEVKTALDALMARHEALRARFSLEREGLRQRIDAVETAAHFESVDLSRHPSPNEALAELRRKEVLHRFDLMRGPLVRLSAVTLANDAHELLVNCHHICADGASFGILSEQLWRIYSARLQGEECRLPELPFHYQDYAEWLGARLESEGAGVAEFWAGRLAGAAARVALPNHPAADGRAGGRAGAVRVRLDGAKLEALRAHCRSNSVTAYAMLLGAWSALLFRMSAQHDLIVATTCDCRVVESLRQQVGLYANVVPIRVSVEGAAKLGEIVSQASARSREALAHCEFPFEASLRLMNRGAAHPESPNVGITWHYPLPILETGVGELVVEAVERNFAHARAELWLHVEEEARSLSLVLEYDEGLFTRDFATLACERLIMVLDAIVADDSRTVADVQLSDPPAPAEAFDFDALVAVPRAEIAG